jgi:hypothetical protein
MGKFGCVGHGDHLLSAGFCGFRRGYQWNEKTRTTVQTALSRLDIIGVILVTWTIRAIGTMDAENGIGGL